MKIADKLKLIIAAPEGSKIVTTKPDTDIENFVELFRKTGMNVMQVRCHQLAGDELIDIPSQYDMVIYENFDSCPRYQFILNQIMGGELNNTLRKALFLISPDTVSDITVPFDPAFLSRCIQLY